MAPSPSEPQPAHGRVLLVDDDDAVREAYSKLLEYEGFDVTPAASGEEAAALFEHQRFHCVVSDITMPGMDGIALLRKIRSYDLDVPVILVTGMPTLDTAISAMDEGAVRYLVKPVDIKTLSAVVSQCVKLARMADLKRQALGELGGLDKLIGDRAGLSVKFESALDSLHMHYQPIVRISTRTIYGYEALVRTREPTIPHAGALFDAAERLGRIPDLSRRIRHFAPIPIAEARDRGQLFLNLHVLDLLDDSLYDPTTALAGIADRVTLEITERAALDDIRDARSRIGRLRAMGFRIAVDDLGAGYAGLDSFAHLEPDVVKLDMGLVRDIHLSPTKQKLVRSMVSLCADMGLDVVAEGVENLAEYETVLTLGCDLIQGFFLGRPGAPFVEPVLP